MFDDTEARPHHLQQFSICDSNTRFAIATVISLHPLLRAFTSRFIRSRLVGYAGRLATAATSQRGGLFIGDVERRCSLVWLPVVAGWPYIC